MARGRTRLTWVLALALMLQVAVPLTGAIAQEPEPEPCVTLPDDVPPTTDTPADDVTGIVTGALQQPCPEPPPSPEETCAGTEDAGKAPDCAHTFAACVAAGTPAAECPVPFQPAVDGVVKTVEDTRDGLLLIINNALACAAPAAGEECACPDPLNDTCQELAAVTACEGEPACVTLFLLERACAAGGAACDQAEVRELRDCADTEDGGPACTDATFLSGMLARACAARGGPSAQSAVCPVNPVVAKPAALATGNPPPTAFQNGSSTFPYIEVTGALAGLTSGGSPLPSLQPPVKVRAGAYGAVAVGASVPGDEDGRLVLQPDGSGAKVIAGGANPGLDLTNAAVTVVVAATPCPTSGTCAPLAQRSMTITGTPAVRGPQASIAVRASSPRAMAGEAIGLSVSFGNEAVAIPEPVVRRITITGAGDATLSHFDGEVWAPVALSNDTGGLTGTYGLTHDDGIIPAGTAEVDRLRLLAPSSGLVSLSVDLVGAHTTAVYASAEAGPVQVLAPQPYSPHEPPPRPEGSTPPQPDGQPGPLPVPGGRLSGEDRAATAAAVSRSSFASHLETAYVATGGAYADALAAGPAAVTTGGPVLLVDRDRIPDSTRTELERLQPGRLLVLGGSSAVSGEVEQQLAELAGEVVRISGADRYATAAAVSAAHFRSGVPVVYVASGEGFADALSGGAAAAAHGGPVLLVQPGAVPSSTAEELRRLAPASIVVLGGPSAVSEEVATELAGYTAGEIRRVHGPDRYATSAAIAADAFSERVDTIFVATGESFPDALAGVPAAGVTRVPLLLVQPDRLPPEVARELDRLRPGRIVILGGERSVSLRLERELRSYETG